MTSDLLGFVTKVMGSSFSFKKLCFLVWLLWIMVFDFESVTEQSKMSCFDKYSCSVKQIRHKNLPFNSVYTKKAHEYIKQ